MEQNEMTFGEVRNIAKQAGIKIYAIVRVTYDDVICIDVKKADFLRQIKDRPTDSIASCCFVADESITIG